MADKNDIRCFRQLADIVSLLSSASQYEQVFHLITDRLQRLFHAQTCAIVIIDMKTEYLRIENSVGVSLTYCKEFRKKVETGPLGKLFWIGEPIHINDADADDEAAELMLEKRFGSCILVQISVNHRPLGYLHIDSAEKGHFSTSDIQIVQTFANLAGIAHFKYFISEKYRRLERRDAETGLDKYGIFMEKVRSVQARANAFDEPFGLILLDVDNFKHISNTYGAENASEVLQSIADCIRSKLRTVDAAGRFGFDEIFMLRVNSDLKDTCDAAEELRGIIADSVFTASGIRTTVSVGVSAFPGNGRTLDELMLTAKHALYEAQRRGRDTVVFYETDWTTGTPETVEKAEF
jgi:diguanylate cyclase (GGDEF)-like protein